ncbi:MAG: SDR family oxidoreductase [Chloroflexi bacterium]|nr:SDR family oxidoreductase [Chloroflexota bacterium]
MENVELPGCLAGRVAVVTGASRGIGKALAIAFAKEGARVVVAARSETEGSLPGTIYQTAEEIKNAGGVALPVRCDLMKSEDVEALGRRALDEFGTVDILVNNAGTGSFSSILKVSVDRWDKVFATNIRGAFLCSRAVLPTMIKNRRGSIINITSMAARVVDASHGPYAASKAALERFTLCLAEEVRGYNIAVNALDPGLILAPGVAEGVTGHGRAWTLVGRRPPETVAPAAIFMAYQDAHFTGRVMKAQEFYVTWPHYIEGRAQSLDNPAPPG